MRTRRLIAAAAAVAVAASACTSSTDGADPAAAGEDIADISDAVLVVDTHEETIDAMLAAAATSWTWDVRISHDFTEDDIAYIQRIAEEEGDDPNVVEPVLDIITAVSMGGATADDDSVQLAISLDDRAVFDLRADLSEVTFDADEPNLAPDIGVLLQFDATYAIDWVDNLEDTLVDLADEFGTDDTSETLNELREEAEMALAGTAFLDPVLALLDGDFAGVVGVLNFEQFGVTEDDLDAFQEELDEFDSERPSLDLSDAHDLMDRGMTFHTFELDDNGNTTVSVDLHLDEARDALDVWFDSAVGEFSPATDPSLEGADELPETLVDAAKVTFDSDGNLTAFNIDLFAVATQLIEEVADSDEGAAEALDILSNLDGTFYLAMSFADHGAVDTVMDVTDAVTLTWDELADAFDDLYMGGMGGMEDFDVEVEKMDELYDDYFECVEASDGDFEECDEALDQALEELMGLSDF